MHRAIILLALGLFLGGCIGTTVRSYTYDIDIRNTAERPVTLELLQARSSTINKLHADLAPGGSFANCYTVHGEAEYLEARLRPGDASPDEPWFVFELPRGRIRSNIVSADGRLTLTPRRPLPPDELP